MIVELTWDSEFFGRKIGRINSVPSEIELKGMLGDAVEKQYKYLTCRLSAAEISTVQRLERSGFYVTDVGVIMGRTLDDPGEPMIHPVEGVAADAIRIRKIAAGLFRGGRFYQDPFFTPEEADRLYQAWAENSLKGSADKVFYIDDRGFIVCKTDGAAGNIPLVGVTAENRSQGVGSSLVRQALLWFKQEGAGSVTVKTQAGNKRAISFYQKQGFSLQTGDITMGKIL
ncbi:MAG: GNAT family N-acetyltransferase [Thermodesulfovibrionales bacterium]